MCTVKDSMLVRNLLETDRSFDFLSRSFVINYSEATSPSLSLITAILYKLELENEKLIAC
jgi:hypothetical protein